MKEHFPVSEWTFKATVWKIVILNDFVWRLKNF